LLENQTHKTHVNKQNRLTWVAQAFAQIPSSVGGKPHGKAPCAEREKGGEQRQTTHAPEHDGVVRELLQRARFRKQARGVGVGVGWCCWCWCWCCAAVSSSSSSSCFLRGLCTTAAPCPAQCRAPACDPPTNDAQTKRSKALAAQGFWIAESERAPLFARRSGQSSYSVEGWRGGVVVAPGTDWTRRRLCWVVHRTSAHPSAPLHPLVVTATG
jgi:hypothetical protein